jgi:hypothetical protein
MTTSASTAMQNATIASIAAERTKGRKGPQARRAARFGTAK